MELISLKRMELLTCFDIIKFIKVHKNLILKLKKKIGYNN